jgi:lysophospholipase L1-like esterase
MNKRNMVQKSKLSVAVRLLFVLLLSSCKVLNAEELPKQDFSAYQFVHCSKDSIVNTGSLTALFQKLEKLRDGDSTTVSIVHIGDSHIQADLLTGEIRRNIQRDFGNSGRGLIFPLRLAGTNEPSDYRITSPNQWTKVFVRSSNRPFEPGVAGVSLLKKDSLPALITLKILQKDTTDYTFDRFSLLYRNDSLPFELMVKDIFDTSKKGITDSTGIFIAGMPENTDEVKIEYPSGNCLIDGFILTKNKPGVIYHNIGINGAHFYDYNRSASFYSQLPVLNPDLIIVSLGTNEGVSPRVTSQMMIAEVEKMLGFIRENNIHCPVLLVTPFDNYYRRKSFNRYLKIVCQGLIEAAEKNELPYIDAYAITGGYSSAAYWRRNGFLGSDRVHYTREGYKLQGKIIYQALVNSYSKWSQQPEK